MEHLTFVEHCVDEDCRYENSNEYSASSFSGNVSSLHRKEKAMEHLASVEHIFIEDCRYENGSEYSVSDFARSSCVVDPTSVDLHFDAECRNQNGSEDSGSDLTGNPSNVFCKKEEEIGEIIQNVFKDLAVLDNIPLEQLNEDTNKDMFLPKMTLISSNLDKIIKNFKKCEESYKKFLEVYPEWENTRSRSIKELQEIAESLDAIKFGCNIGKIVGSSVGAAGGVLGIVSAALIPFTMGLSIPFAIGSITTAAVGGVTGLSSGITEVILLKRNVEVAQNILKDDEKQFQPLKEWFEHSVSYVESLNELMEVDVFGKILTDFKKLMSSITSCAAPGKVTTQCAYDALRGLVCSSDQLLVIISIFLNPVLLKVFQEIVKMHSENPFVFQCATVTACVCFQILKGVDMGTDCFAAITALTKLSTSALGSSFGKVVSQGIFSALGLAFDVTSLVLTSIDVHNGSMCPNAQKIRDVSNHLSEEFDVLKRAYSQLCVRKNQYNELGAQ